jgi:hypothetical protein
LKIKKPRHFRGLEIFRLSRLQLGKSTPGPEFNTAGLLEKCHQYLRIYMNHLSTINQGRFPSQENKGIAGCMLICFDKQKDIVLI